MPANKARGRKRTPKAAPPAAGTNPARPRQATADNARAQANAGKAARKIRKTGMSTNMKVTLGIVAATLVALIGVMVVNHDEAPTGQAASEMLVRADSHRLSTAADGRTTVVEFLDFECESCLAAYPGGEAARRVRRPDHLRGALLPDPQPPERLQRRVRRRGRGPAGQVRGDVQEAVRHRDGLGHQRQSQLAVFEGYAQELGLDLARFKADVASAEVAARVKADAADGETLGVRGTPTFFINGERFDGRSDYARLKAAVDASLNS